MRVIYAQRRRHDLDRIRKHIAPESGSDEVADRFLVRLIDACDALAVLPERYPPYRFGGMWRMMPFENYLVFFQIHHEEVRVGHVRHAARMPFRG